MANKTATLKNQAGDNIYPNIVGDNRNAAIKDSITIKHTLAENKISLDLDETVRGKIDAALQKPAGLTKTELVGVGTNGQENIEIGDNLTLANGKLSATGGDGGSGGTPRHVYNVFFDYDCYYTIYTTKDYKLPIGIYQEAPDFRTNDKYNELRPYSGAFPANGYYYKADNGTKWIIYSASVSGPTSSYYISGYNLTNNSKGSASISVNHYGIKQLF